MMSAGALEMAANQLRRAVATGSHVEAAALAADYCRALEEEVLGLHTDDPRLVRMQREALDLLEWARRTGLAARAHCAAQLAALPDLRPYSTPSRPKHIWDVEG